MPAVLDLDPIPRSAWLDRSQVTEGESEVLALVQYHVTDPICDIGGSVGNLLPEANFRMMVWPDKITPLKL
jgi:hypothetical protein